MGAPAAKIDEVQQIFTLLIDFNEAAKHFNIMLQLCHNWPILVNAYV